MDKMIKHLRKKIQNLHKRGFTLIEILVAITILSTLVVGAITTLNPLGQIGKSQDAVRQKDLNQIKLALDLYYSDKNCYPALSSSPFVTALKNGTEWKEGSTVYMKKVPRDPLTNLTYTYITDETVCPQWATIFAKLSKPSLLATSCPLTAQSSCVPQGFDNTYACVTLGNTNCGTLLASRLGNLPIQSPTPTTTATPTGTTPTPTPTSPPSDQDFDVAQPAGTNPQFYQGTISPLFQQIGKTQKVIVKVAGVTANVSSVSVTVKSDTKIQTYTSSMTGGTPTDGTWTASWIVNDTTIKRFMITLSGTDTNGTSSTFDISIR